MRDKKLAKLYVYVDLWRKSAMVLPIPNPAQLPRSDCLGQSQGLKGQIIRVLFWGHSLTAAEPQTQGTLVVFLWNCKWE